MVAVGDAGGGRRRWVLLVCVEVVVRRHYDWRHGEAMHQDVLTAEGTVGRCRSGEVGRSDNNKDNLKPKLPRTLSQVDGL